MTQFCALMALFLIGAAVGAERLNPDGDARAPSLECELNGMITAGTSACSCFDGWVGPTCGTLDLLPGAVIWPAQHPSRLGSQEWWGDGNTPSGWGGTIQHDAATGKYHLVAATGCYLPARIMHMDGWQISSGVADQVEGPYTFQSVVSESATAFNPHSAQLPDGRVILFFCGAHTVPTASGYSSTCTGNEKPRQAHTGTEPKRKTPPASSSNCTVDDCYNADCQPQNYGKTCDVCSNAGCVCDPGFGVRNPTNLLHQFMTALRRFEPSILRVRRSATRRSTIRHPRFKCASAARWLGRGKTSRTSESKGWTTFWRWCHLANADTVVLLTPSPRSS